MDEKRFVLIDLERSVKTGVIHYWKSGGRGYTRYVNEVGIFGETAAKTYVVNDFDRQTVGISEDRFKRLAGIE